MRLVFAALRGLPLLALLGAAPADLNQGWTQAESQTFWNNPQGSRIVPYAWFLALERMDSGGKFADPANLAQYGFLSATPTTLNPDALPIGLSRETDRTGGLWLGMTCAACHASTIHRDGKARLVEGGGSMLDQQRFDRDLSAALVGTSSDDTRFERFASQLGQAAGDKDALRKDVQLTAATRMAFTTMNHTAVDHGPGRVDALGVIMNALTATALDKPSNARPPDAPVRLPWLWNSSSYTRVQYNGSISNAGLGPLLRNIGQVLGVYGTADLSKPGLTYPSSVSVADLKTLEMLVAKLEPPAWPVDMLGPINAEKAARGGEVFAQACASCHGARERDANGLVPVPLVALDQVGTDPRAARNFMTRPAETGFLEGRPIGVFGGPVFGPRAGAATIVGHVSTAVAAQLPRDQLQTGLGVYRTAIGASPGRLDAYKAIPLAGVWAGAPYLHNGSVANLKELLLPPGERATRFTVGGRDYDPSAVGYPADTAVPGFVLDTTLPGNGNSGHTYGTDLPDAAKADLLEYLKTL